MIANFGNFGETAPQWSLRFDDNWYPGDSSECHLGDPSSGYSGTGSCLADYEAFTERSDDVAASGDASGGTSASTWDILNEAATTEEPVTNTAVVFMIAQPSDLAACVVDISWSAAAR